MRSRRTRIFNIITLVFIVLSVLWVLFVAVRFAEPAPAPPPAVIVPTALILPSPTASFTYSRTPTLTPSITPSQTPTYTVTPRTTATSSPSPAQVDALQPSATITETLVATLTPEATTPAPAPTSNFTSQPTPPPGSPYPFIVRDQGPIFTRNFANTAGCAWQGIGGQVFDISGAPLQGVNVHVFGNGIDVTTTSGSNTLYGVSGFEVAVANGINSNSYMIELQSAAGTIISPQQMVIFANDCEQNLALVNFQQTRPY